MNEKTEPTTFEVRAVTNSALGVQDVYEALRKSGIVVHEVRKTDR